MSLRIRKDGRILCAAMHPAEDGDTYIDDALHYQMSVIHKVIGTDHLHLPEGDRPGHGQWWWTGNVPPGIALDSFYTTTPQA